VKLDGIVALVLQNIVSGIVVDALVPNTRVILRHSTMVDVPIHLNILLLARTAVVPVRAPLTLPLEAGILADIGISPLVLLVLAVCLLALLLDVDLYLRLPKNNPGVVMTRVLTVVRYRQENMSASLRCSKGRLHHR